MRIVLGFDGSEAAQIALQFVLNRAWPSGTQVAVVGAVAPVVDWDVMTPGAAGMSGAAGLQEVTARVDDAASALVLRGLDASTDVAMGDPADRIADRAERWFADLIVVGNRRRGAFASAVFGSVGAHLVDHAPCPVLVARADTANRMLIAADGTPSSSDIPRLLDSWGPSFRELPVEVLSVAVRDDPITPWVAGIERPEDLAEHERIAASTAAELAALGWSAIPVTRSGVPDRVIVDAAEEYRADLIVTGSRGIGTIQRLIAGSVAHDVLLHTRSSVLVMRGHVWAKLHNPVRVGTPAMA